MERRYCRRMKRWPWILVAAVGVVGFVLTAFFFMLVWGMSRHFDPVPGTVIIAIGVGFLALAVAG